jgi:NAD(P)-dependent dehydrogenase (short-subunit alcohol dehydrogenase family)
MEIAGGSAVVSGGASGLGRAVVERLLAGGAQVVVLDLPSSPGEALAAQLGPGAVFVAGDVTDAGSVAAAVQVAADRAPLRVAVAAAGVVGTQRRLLGRDGPLRTDQVRPVLEVNVLGTVHLLVHAAEAMSRTKPVDGERGVVVCTASIAAYDGQVGQLAYAASKGAVAAMVLPAARDLARHLVRVMAIAPGLFDTPMLAGVSEEARRTAAEQVPHPARHGRPEEFAALVEHVVANPMLNGEVVRLDGAVRLPPR